MCVLVHTCSYCVATSLFDEGEDSKRSAKILLGGELGDQDDEELFVPKEARVQGEVKEDRLFETEDNSELLKYVIVGYSSES